MNTRAKGKIGETIAEKYLKENNYNILAKNYYTRWGEIDIVARDETNEELVFVEVKMRQSKTCGYPEEAVDDYKLERMEEAAGIYLEKFGLEDKYRFDCLAIEREISRGKVEIKHYKNIGLV
ncbi:YraN family protein [Candidatus Kuenenbacteria bacterium]|nr:YraN family protein [Candidatus Kuenenbacteria bacterium]